MITVETYLGAFCTRPRWVRVSGFPVLLASLLLCCTAPAAPKIFAPEPSYDFGTLDNQQTVKHDFVLQNTGDEDLELINVKTSCGCTVGELKTKLLKPGEETTVSATVSLKGRQGPQVKNLTVESNDSAQPLFKLEVRGTAISGVMVEPRSLNFGRILDDEIHSMKVTVTADQPDNPAKIMGVESTLDLFETEVREVKEGRLYEITLRNKAPLASGNHAGRLIIKTDNPEYAQLDVGFFAQVIGEVEISPPQVMLRFNEDSTKRTSQYLRVAAGRQKEFTITEVISPTEEVQVELQPRTPNDYLIKLSEMPMDGSLDDKFLVVKTDLPQQPEIKIQFQTIKPRPVAEQLQRPTRPVAEQLQRPTAPTTGN